MLPLPILALVPVLLPLPQTYACSDVRVRTYQGQLGPEGGQLIATSMPPSATLGYGGKVAFVGNLTGIQRNQTILAADGPSLRAIAFGCGGAGGSGAPGDCGDPTPIGGTFGGFFGDPWFAPSTNANGDVVFLADVANGGTPRGLFLYREASHAIETVAYVGQLSPSGAAITGLGVATVDDRGGVLFLARTQPSIGPANEILANDGGVLTLLAAVGGNGPDGPYDSVSGEIQLWPDGTSTATGPAPARDANGRIAFVATTSITQNYGIVVKEPGQPPLWLASFHQPTPAGGGFTRFSGPMFAWDGEIAFSAQYTFGSGTRAGWFAGSPGSLRTVIAWGTPVGDVTCWIFDRSHDSFHALGRAGDAVVWSLVQHQDRSYGEALVLVRRNGNAEVVVETGDTPPTGGVIAELGRLPSIDTSGRIVVTAKIDQGPATNATWILAPCGISASYCDGKPSSLGCEPRIGSIGCASATGTFAFVVNGESLPSRRSAMLVYGFATASAPFQGGTLCVAHPQRTLVVTSTGPSPSDCTGTLSFDFGARIASGIDPALAAGTSVAAQWFVRDPADPAGFGTTLSDAILFTIGP